MSKAVEVDGHHSVLFAITALDLVWREARPELRPGAVGEPLPTTVAAWSGAGDGVR